MEREEKRDSKNPGITMRAPYGGMVPLSMSLNIQSRRFSREYISRFFETISWKLGNRMSPREEDYQYYRFNL